jgi:hypothetical protein
MRLITSYYGRLKREEKCLIVIEMFMLQKRDSIISRRTLDQDGNKIG